MGVLKKASLYIADAVWSLLILSTLTVFYWRGTWKILDLYILPDNFGNSAWISYAVGEILLLAFYFTQNILDRNITSNNKWIYEIAVRVHNFVQGFAIVNKWRGVWLLIDHYTGVTAVSALSTVAIGIFCLCLLRAFKNVFASPSNISLDCSEKPFVCTTRFSQTTGILWRYILDILLTVAVIHTLVVVYWRGVWTLMDRWLHPQDTRISGIASLGTGYAILSAALVLQPVVKQTLQALRNLALPRVLVADVFGVIVAFGTVNVWRGVWYLADAYIYPDNVELSVWLTAGVGFGGLLLVLASGTVLVKGCLIDGASEDIESNVIPNQYFTYFFNKHVERPSQKNLDCNHTTAIGQI